MSFLSTTKPPSGCEAQCPECGVTLSRLADMNRHRKTKHSDGTEIKFPCPLPGCQYKTLQKGNLKTHLVARHSDGPQYPCPECNRLYSDAAARIRHRKRVHGYEPYHTKEYLVRAKQALVEREEVAQGPGKAISTKGRRQRAASAAPYSLPNAPSSGAPLKVPKAVHHDDFWKTLINIARSYASDPQYSQEVQLSAPFASTPGRDAPEVIQPFGSLTFGKSPFLKVREPECQPAVPLNGDGSGSFDPLLDDMLSQGQAFAWSSTKGTNAVSPMPSDFAPLPSPNATSIAPFPTSAGPLAYPEVGLLNDLQNYPMDSYGCNNASSSMYAIPDPPMSTPSPSATLQLPFVPTNYGPAQPLEPVPEPSWTPTSQQAVSTSFPNLDDFTSGVTDFDNWCKLNMIY